MKAGWTSLPVELRAHIASKAHTDLDAASLHFADRNKSSKAGCLFTQSRNAEDARFLEVVRKNLNTLRAPPSCEVPDHLQIEPLSWSEKIVDGDVEYHVSKFVVAGRVCFLIASYLWQADERVVLRGTPRRLLSLGSADNVVSFFAGVSRMSCLQAVAVDPWVGL